MTWSIVEVDNKGFTGAPTLMNIYIIPRSISFMTLNGFPKLDFDIVMRLVKLYKMSLEATLIPLVVESSEEGGNETTSLSPNQNLGP
jgi:hypothetical protein